MPLTTPFLKPHVTDTAPEGVSAATKRQTLAQVIVCLGCCCGRTDRGRPEVPVDWLKAEWKRRRLLKQVQLTISGCLGPCDVPNVAAVASAEGTTWLHHLTTRAHFEALLGWATATADAGRVLPLPAALAPHAFDRFLV
jgi:cobaltochelatase CobN